MKKQVLVKVEIKPLPDTCGIDLVSQQPICTPTLSTAEPIFVAASIDQGQIFRYPMSSFKQNMETNPNTHDMVLEFNSNTNWYFARRENEGKVEIGQQYDFECKHC